MPSIDLVFFNAGGGHRAGTWQVRLINLMEVLDPKDLYNTRLARGWSLGLAQELKFLQALIRLAHPAMTKRLRGYWRRTKPYLVVSLIPNFNRCMYEALSIARPGVPYVTILTDFADLPPHFWIEPRQAQYLVCGTGKAVAQAHSLDYRRAQVHATSGMIVRPEFYRKSSADRRAGLVELKRDPDRPPGIVHSAGRDRKLCGVLRDG